MITFDRVTVTLPGAAEPVLRDVTATVAEGELCLVVGRTGSGKSTLLRCVNGLVPHFSGGRLAGDVAVAGRSTRTHRPRDLADLVGVVGQDPVAGFVTDRVEDELAFGMESLGIAPAVMRRRVEEALDLLGLAEVRDRPLLSLSGGQQQRVAIGAVLTVHPSVLVLDEPTSALDPPAAEEVLAALTRLVHDLGLTVLVAEHRLERVVQYADSVLHLPGDGSLRCGPPADILATTDVAPPVITLGRLAGWSPLPLSVRDARRVAGPLRDRLAAAPVPVPVPVYSMPGAARHSTTDAPGIEWGTGAAAPIARLTGVGVVRGQTVALRSVDLALHPGEVVALMGRNGAGKSTLLGVLAGLLRPDAGRADVGGQAPHTLAPPQLVRRVGLVPQQPADLLYAETVAAECRGADRETRLPAGATAAALERLVPGLSAQHAGTHPRDLSEGQRLALALAVVVAGAPPLLLLDEPTRGLDYPAKERLAAMLRELAAAGHTVLLATHDVELVADVAGRTIVLADGDVVADGPSREVVTQSPAFAPQIFKVLAPGPWLTTADVERSLAVR